MNEAADKGIADLTLHLELHRDLIQLATLAIDELVVNDQCRLCNPTPCHCWVSALKDVIKLIRETSPTIHVPEEDRFVRIRTERYRENYFIEGSVDGLVALIFTITNALREKETKVTLEFNGQSQSPSLYNIVVRNLDLWQPKK